MPCAHLQAASNACRQLLDQIARARGDPHPFNVVVERCPAVHSCTRPGAHDPIRHFRATANAGIEDLPTRIELNALLHCGGYCYVFVLTHRHPRLGDLPSGDFQRQWTIGDCTKGTLRSDDDIVV